MNTDDLRVEPVPGSPVSLKKFIDAEKKLTTFNIIVDGTPERAGVLPDDPNTFNVTIAAREEQALYFLGQNLPMPNYLRKYLKMIYPRLDDAGVDAMYAQARNNRGLLSMIGMIQLIAGGLSMARKQGKFIRFFIELPETYMHPEQCAHMASALIAIVNDYGPPENAPEATS